MCLEDIKNVKIKDAVVNEPIILITHVSVFNLLLNRLNVHRIMRTPERDINKRTKSDFILTPANFRLSFSPDNKYRSLIYPPKANSYISLTPASLSFIYIVSSYVILKGLFKDRVRMFFIAELFLMVFLMIIILIADVIKILVSGVMEVKISIIGIMDVKRFLERLGIKESDSWISTLSEARSQD